ncbi:MATE family efflux transporter, partial [Clostridioides difficile]
KKQRTAEDVIGTSIFLAIIVSLILAIVIKMNLNNITNLLNISSEDRVFFNDYFNNFLQYLPIYFLSHILTYILRAQGKAFLVMCLSF